MILRSVTTAVGFVRPGPRCLWRSRYDSDHSADAGARNGERRTSQTPTLRRHRRRRRASHCRDAGGDDPAGPARRLARRARAGTGVAAPPHPRPPGAVRPGVRDRRSWSPRSCAPPASSRGCWPRATASSATSAPASAWSRCGPTSTRCRCRTPRTCPTGPLWTTSATPAATTCTPRSWSASAGSWRSWSATGELPGRVRLIFQPSEEQFPSGAPEVIAEGGLKDVESIFALHCFPQLPAGLVAVRSGPITAAADMVEIRLTGPGGHTARPHLTVDLVHALGRIVVEVPALLSRRLDPRAAASLVFGAVRAGEAHNAIADEGFARGTVRVLNRDAWRQLPELVPQLGARRRRRHRAPRRTSTTCAACRRWSTTASPPRSSPVPRPRPSARTGSSRPRSAWAARTSPSTSSRCPAR